VRINFSNAWLEKFLVNLSPTGIPKVKGTNAIITTKNNPQLKKEKRVKSTSCAPAIAPKKQEMVNINSFLFIVIEFK